MAGPDTTWTVWWWDDRDADHIPVPMSRRFDTEAEAVEFAGGLTKDPPEWLGWVKAFRSDNEGYVAFRWQRPDDGFETASEWNQWVDSTFREPPRELFFSLLVTGLALALVLVIFINYLIYR